MVDSKENYNFNVGVKRVNILFEGCTFFSWRALPTDLEYDMFAFQIYTVVIIVRKILNFINRSCIACIYTVTAKSNAASILLHGFMVQTENKLKYYLRTFLWM